MIPGLLLGLGFAQEDHGGVAPPTVVAAPRAIPAGPPRTVLATPDQPLHTVLAGLPAGSTIELAPGTYAGALLIDRPITLRGRGAILRGDGQGSVVIVAAPGVRLEGLEIVGSGRDPTRGDAGIVVGADDVMIEGLTLSEVLIGIDFRMANHGTVRNCHLTGPEDGTVGLRGDGIRLWESDHNRIEGNVLQHVRDMVVWYSEGNTLIGNRVDHSRYGIHFMHADDNHVEGNTFQDDVVGVFVMYSQHITLDHNVVAGANGAAGVGFGFKESDQVEVRDNVLAGNTTGIYLDTTPQRLGGSAILADNLLAYNTTGVRFHGIHPGARFENNVFHENPVQVVVDGGVSATEVVFAGNHWSDYSGYDLDHDGVGDLPYAPRRLSRGLMDRQPVASFFDGTPAALLLDFLGAAFPMWTPPPLFTDLRPKLAARGL